MDEVMMRSTCGALMELLAEDKDKRISELEQENERLCEELVKANNEFGSETSDWPDLWRRISELKLDSGRNYIRGMERAAKMIDDGRPYGNEYANEIRAEITDTET